jgi:AcrR family transcriptional regulator
MPRQSTEIRQEQIAGIVLEIITDHGLESLSMPGVASRLGLVQSALYRHFNNKEEMIAAAMKLAKSRMIGLVLNAVSGKSDAMKALRSVLASFDEFRKIAVIFPRIVFSLPDGDTLESRRDSVRQIVEEILSNIENVICEGQRIGKIKKSLDPAVVAIQFWGILVTANLRWHLTGGDFDVESHMNDAWKFFKNAVAP